MYAFSGVPRFLNRRNVIVTGVDFRWRIVGDMTGWLGSSVVECSHGQRKALGSITGRATLFTCYILYAFSGVSRFSDLRYVMRLSYKEIRKGNTIF